MRIMGNLYTDNLIGTVIELSDADDWEGARREWEVVGCEIDETHSATSEGSGRVFDGIDFVFAVDGNPRWRHLGFLVSGRAGNPAEKAWERVRRHPLFHAFSALALIEYQCSPAKAALTSRKMWEAYIQSHVNGTFSYTSILLPSGFRSLDGRALALREIGNLGLPILVTQQSERSLSCLSQTVAAPIRL